MNIRKAERKQAKIKMAIMGPSGSGKTYSSLLIAKGLCGSFDKVCIIDTENGSSDLYANLGSYSTIAISTPYAPEKYIQAIEMAETEGMEVIILDSISHCWEYLIDYHSGMLGNSFTNWSKITPRHNALFTKILSSKLHIIATLRVKQDYVLAEKNGKMVPEKIGLKAIQRNGVDYEFTLVFDLNIRHQASCSKDRTGLFINSPEFTLGESTGDSIRQWCTGTEDIASRIQSAKSLKELLEIYKTNGNEDLLKLFTERKTILTNQLKINENGKY
ncbi:MAG: AAA family ATPase [Saprospiraceae bacterium]